jgi:hypothetical protein
MKMLLILLTPLFAVSISANGNKMKDKMLTVTFCEMVKHPEKYFNKTIRITATFTQSVEAQYLNDDKKCPLSHDHRIGVSYPETNEKQIAEINESIDRIQSEEFGSRAIVTVVGKLKNVSARRFAWYQYRFDIAKFEKISQVVEEYKGELESAKTYRAEVRADKNFGIYFVKTYKLPFHYALRIEWTNLKDFPELKSFIKKKIIFTALSNEIKQIDENRWNIEIHCKIILVE